MELITLDPSMVVDRLERVRKDWGDMDGLVNSFKEHGQIQPILITKDGESYILVAGGRRRRAATIAGMRLSCVIRESCTDIELRELELEENLQRADLTWQERTNGIAELHALKQKIHGVKGVGRGQDGHAQSDTAKLLGVTQQRVSQALKLSDAMKAIPALALAKSEKDANKILDKLEEKVLIAELVKRQAAKESPAMAAAAHFIIEDAFIAMKRVPSESINFANVDTPYAIDLKHNKKIQSASQGVRTDIDYTEWDFVDYLSKVEHTLAEVYRMLKPDSWMIFWFGIQWYAPLKTAIEKAGFEVDKIPGIWYGGAGGAQTMQPEKNLARSYDTFFLCRKGNPVMVKRGHANVFPFDKVPPQNKIHPTEKPLELMKELFSLFLLPGMICISPFLGSGNDLRAFYILGANGFGYELDEALKNKFLLRVEDDIKNKLY